jgi:predicted nucleic acid-binding Zn ribbon protein
MQKSNEQSIREAIDLMLRTYGLDGRMKEIRLIDSWEKVMGKPVARHTREIFIRERKLFVRLDSAALREELSYGKEKILKMLNDEAGERVIDEVVLQ